MIKFTKEELEEMRRADEEIEREFTLSNEDLKRSRALDREVRLGRMSPEKRKVAASQKAYREANREKVAASQKAYREANREKVAASQKAYYEANREKVAAYQKAYYEANREKVAASQKAYREANREKVAASQKAYYEANREKVAGYQKILIRGYRKERGLTQQDLARTLGVSRQLICHWETGRSVADPETWRELAPEMAEQLSCGLEGVQI